MNSPLLAKSSYCKNMEIYSISYGVIHFCSYVILFKIIGLSFHYNLSNTFISFQSNQFFSKPFQEKSFSDSKCNHYTHIKIKKNIIKAENPKISIKQTSFLLFFEDPFFSKIKSILYHVQFNFKIFKKVQPTMNTSF